MKQDLSKNNPKLKRRPLKNGGVSLYLEYYLGRSQEPRLDKDGNPLRYTTGKMAGKPMYIIKHKRAKEELGLYLLARPRTPEEKNRNEETILLAQRIRAEKEQERLQGIAGYRIPKFSNKDNVIKFFENYLSDYAQTDVRNMRLALNRFKTYLRTCHPLTVRKKTVTEIEAIKKAWEEKHKSVYGKHELNDNELYEYLLKPKQLTPEMVKGFVSFLQENSEGSGAKVAFVRFKKLVKRAEEQGLFRANPCEGVKCEGGTCAEKDIMTIEEINTLLNTHYENENEEIRRAFIFSLYSGVRFCDVRELTYSNVDYNQGVIKFEQKKTRGHSKKSSVKIPLRADLLEIIGKPEPGINDESERIFNLPSHTMCLKALRHWTARAGITKHITWHSARHSFATNILEGGANIKVVADLLGHSGLRYVERYTRALEEAKAAAINYLPEIKSNK